MTTPYRSLPSLQSLRCFEAAARLGSFGLAADEICITHSAISHQIRALEASIGQPLFRRVGNRMSLTVVGRALAVETKRALDYLSQAYAVAQVADIPRKGSLNLAAQTSIVEHWLLPRLLAFCAQLGEYGLRISSLGDLSEIVPDDADVALIYGTGDVPGMIAKKLCDETVFPVCSADFLRRHPELSVERLAEFPLLLHSKVTWNLWLEKANLPISYPDRSIVFDDITLTIRAALTGHGIAMARSVLVRDHLAEGNLVRISDLSVAGVFAYYLAWRTEDIRSRSGAVENWIINNLVPCNE